MTSLEHVSFSYGDKAVFQDFSYEFKSGCATAVTGPSGAGKTTLLGILTESLKPDVGFVHTDAPLAVMYQEPRLLPWFSVKKNLTVVLHNRNNSADAALDLISFLQKRKDSVNTASNEISFFQKRNDPVAEKWLSMVHLEHEADSYPDSLSGGMQQRVSLARLLAYAEKTQASLIILDEPFSALDPQLHKEMRDLTLEKLKGKTIIMITHDNEDAEACDQKLVIGENGNISCNV